MQSMLIRGGAVIQAEDDEELPEQMLATSYLTYLDPSKARNFDPILTEYLSDERNQTVRPLSGSLGVA